MIQSKADFVNNPEEGIVKAIALRFNTELFSKIKVPLDRKIEQIAHGIGAALDVECVVTYDYKYPPVTNDAQVTTEVVNSLEEIFPGQLVEVEEPLMGGEDYAYYLYEAPGTFLFLSNPSNIEGKFHGHHHAKFDVDESLFYMATAAFVKVALDYLN
ncbi:M20/M25/M40 family metallo-hydrolase [Ruoffia sp. FAM 24228]